MAAVSLKTLPFLACDVSVPLEQIKPPEPSLATRAIFREALEKGKTKAKVTRPVLDVPSSGKSVEVIILPELAGHVYLCRAEEIGNQKKVNIKYSQAKLDFLFFGIVVVGIAFSVHFLAVSVLILVSQKTASVIIFPPAAFILGASFYRLLNLKNEFIIDHTKLSEFERTIKLFKEYFVQNRVDKLKNYIESKIQESTGDSEKQQKYTTALKELTTVYEFSQIA